MRSLKYLTLGLLPAALITFSTLLTSCTNGKGNYYLSTPEVHTTTTTQSGLEREIHGVHQIPPHLIDDIANHMGQYNPEYNHTH
tara:strand:- start:559 stop:810 length:252 start_codon:yes stop_codon:yes gene_type:complete